MDWRRDITAELRIAPRSWDSSTEPTKLTTRRMRYRKRAMAAGMEEGREREESRWKGRRRKRRTEEGREVGCALCLYVF